MRTIVLTVLLATAATAATAQQPDYREQLLAQYGEVGSEMLNAFEPNLPVLCPNPDSTNWSVVAGTFTRTGRWIQPNKPPNNYPIAITVVESAAPAIVAVNPDGTWMLSTVAGLEWQVIRLRAQNVLTPEQIKQLPEGKGPAAVEVLIFVRGIPAIENDPPILLLFGGTA